MTQKNTDNEIREKLRESGYDRTYTVWTKEEDHALLRYYNQDGLSKLEIASALKRTLGSINSRLKLHAEVAPTQNLLDINFISYIKQGVNPVTGEDLDEGSVWRHPAILDDLSIYIGTSDAHADLSTHVDKHVETNSYDHQDAQRNLSDIEFNILCELIQNIDLLLPNETERNYEVMRSLYNTSPLSKNTLRNVGEKLNISHERVRQIRNKVLRKLLDAIKQRSQKVNNKKITEDRKLTKLDALEYLSSVLDLIAENAAHHEKTEQVGNIVTSVQETEIGHEKIFYIEKRQTFTPMRADHHLIKRGIFSDKKKIQNYRESNKRLGYLSNSGFPVTQEEIDFILQFSRSGKSIDEMESFFQRSRVSISKIIEEYS
ncbi:hypothetical protein N9413_08895 [Paracoccaceae bacterium]|jgi:hypothetical protein|nr:hypothetical protein [Paracoccaceae bacterium]